jgi:hypothetical protein
MRICLLVLLLLIGSTTSVAAQSTARSVTWQRLDADLVVQTDGSLNATETQTIAFQGAYHEVFRVIALDRTSGITDISVFEMNSAGQSTPLQFTTSTDSSGLTITWQFQTVTDDARTFVLRYTAHDATRVYAAGDQVDWNAIYANRPGPVQSSTVTMHLPSDVPQGALISALYTLPQGRLPQQVGTATLVDPRTLRFDVGSLPASTGAEVRAQVPQQVLPQAVAPAWQAAADRADWIQQNVAPIADFLVLLLSASIVAGGGLLVMLLWYSRVRDPAVGPAPPMLEQRPSELPAPLAGTLVDGVADLQDVVAILLDLARTGVISLKEEHTPEGSDVRVALHRSSLDPSLQRYERVLLVALFGEHTDHGDLLLSRARIRFVSAVPILEERLYDAVVNEGLFAANPLRERRRFARIGWIAAVVGVALALLASFAIGAISALAWLPGLLVVILGIGIVWLSRKMPRRTQRGALEAARWRAFRTHLLQQPEVQHDGLDGADLAYAVALGADRQFLHRLESSGSPPPAWYGGGRPGGGPIVFVPGGWYGGPGWRGGSGYGSPMPTGTIGAPTGGGMGNPQGWSDALADLLNAASGALSHGGGSGPWSGGGWGGGGGGGGGSGGAN